MSGHTAYARANGLDSLERESWRLFGVPLSYEQVDTYIAGGAEAHGMLDDMEARMGFRVQIARGGL